MQIEVKCNISKREFPDDIHKSEITEYITKVMISKLWSHISENCLKTLVCDHNTAEVTMKSIFIENAEGFLNKVNELLDDPGMSKKEFRESLKSLIDNS